MEEPPVAATSDPGPWTSLLVSDEVREVLANARTLSVLHPVEEVGSTQDLAATLASAGSPGGTVVVADRQVAGRGRVGRSWDDRPDGGTLALTVLLDVGSQVPDADPLGLVPHALGLAVLRACGRTIPGLRGLRLKWPNDVVRRASPRAAPRKLCGILVERERIASLSGPRDVLLCGIGVNVDLGQGGGEDRTCLQALAGRRPDGTALLASLFGELDEAIVLLGRDPSAILDRYRSVSDTIGREIRAEPAGGAPIVGLAEDVDAAGRLVVTTAAGRHAILSGTVRDAADAEGSGP